VVVVVAEQTLVTIPLVVEVLVDSVLPQDFLLLLEQLIQLLLVLVEMAVLAEARHIM
jgi:hypothetical protein